MTIDCMYCELEFRSKLLLAIHLLQVHLLKKRSVQCENDRRSTDDIRECPTIDSFSFHYKSGFFPLLLAPWLSLLNLFNAAVQLLIDCFVSCPHLLRCLLSILNSHHHFNPHLLRPWPSPAAWTQASSTPSSTSNTRWCWWCWWWRGCGDVQKPSIWTHLRCPYCILAEYRRQLVFLFVKFFSRVPTFDSSPMITLVMVYSIRIQMMFLTFSSVVFLF